MNEQTPSAGPPPTGPPPGPPAGPPTGPPPSSTPSGAGRGLSRNQWLAIVIVVVLVVGIGAGLLLAGGDGGGEEAEVFLEPVNTAHQPFTESVGTDVAEVTASTSTTAPPSTTGIPVVSGATEGLYGGTLDTGSCDPAKLVDFLERNPAKGAAWAAVVGIQPGEIRSYVATLTPVILRTDTRVTNHGWVNGRANPIPAVLQAGTAVLVDRYGQPVAKCYCGNPLSPPKAISKPVYTGTRWTGFSPTSITVINQSTTVINVFVLVDPRTGERFGRPAGTDGSDDGPVPPTSGSTTSTTGPTTTTRPPGVLVDGNYTISVASGSYPGCGEVTGGSVPMTVAGDQLTITDPESGTVYSGTVERTGGTFSMSATELGATFVLEGRIDDTGYVTATLTFRDGVSCQLPVTGHRT